LELFSILLRSPLSLTQIRVTVDWERTAPYPTDKRE
jgi:hypothetical protein